jgi:DnaA-like protein
VSIYDDHCKTADDVRANARRVHLLRRETWKPRPIIIEPPPTPPPEKKRPSRAVGPRVVADPPLPEPPPPVPLHISVRSVIQAAAAHFDVSFIDLLAMRRRHDLCYRRHIAMYVAAAVTTSSLVQIGRMFQRDHTTILHGVGRIKELISSGDTQANADVVAVRARIDRFVAGDLSAVVAPPYCPLPPPVHIEKRLPRRLWTQEEDDVVRELYGRQRKTSKEVAQVLGRSWKSVKTRAQKLHFTADRTGPRLRDASESVGRERD